MASVSESHATSNGTKRNGRRNVKGPLKIKLSMAVFVNSSAYLNEIVSTINDALHMSDFKKSNVKYSNTAIVKR